MIQSSDFSRDLFHAHDLLQQGYLGSCIKECGSLLEAALRTLYQQVLLKLTTEQLQELRQAETSIFPGPNWEKMGLGHLIGLFHRAKIFQKIESSLDLPAGQLKIFNFDQLLDLRNKVVHQQYQPLETETHLAYYSLAEFLRQSRLVEQLPSKGPVSKQHFDASELYAYVLRLVPDPTEVTVEVRQVLDDIAVELELSLKLIRQLEQNARSQPYLKPGKSWVSTQVSSYAVWLARSKSATQYAVRFYKQLCDEQEELEIDFTHPEVIRYMRKGFSWMELKPNLNGFIFYLADPGFRPPGPSAWFLALCELLKTMSNEMADFYGVPVWDPEYDQGLHPIRFQLPTDWMHDYRVWELLADNYALFTTLYQDNLSSDAETGSASK